MSFQEGSPGDAADVPGGLVAMARTLLRLGWVSAVRPRDVGPVHRFHGRLVDRIRNLEHAHGFFDLGMSLPILFYGVSELVRGCGVRRDEILRGLFGWHHHPSL